jgi:FkbM family methyltransferase
MGKGEKWTLYPWTSYWRGTHEPALQQVIIELGQGNITGWSCWDLGAHFGFYSVALAMRTGPSGQVAAFEPNPQSYERLELHRRMNKLDWMISFEAAASNKEGVSELLTYGELDSTSTHLQYDGEAISSASKPLSIRTVSLDTLVGSGRLRAPQFVKIDVEGHGHKALEGMKAALAQTKPILIVGFHSDEEVAGSLAVLKPLGYKWSAITKAPGNQDTLVGGDYLFTV